MDRNTETPPGPASDPSSKSDVLLLVAGEGMVSTFELEDRELVIGRGEGCDIVIDHRALSRRHAVVRPGPPVTVQDLGSTNGTHVGGAAHRAGDPVVVTGSFKIGPYSFLLVARAPGVESSLSTHGALRVVDPTLRGVPTMVKDIAESPASVLILGQTGVGKEVLAETLHQLSQRGGALTRINCAALSESLLESELFGHEKGAFTGAGGARIGLLESADGGTVFLDEVGELPLSIQAKLLRAVEHREILRVGSVRPKQIDVRYIAATHRDLPAEVAAGTFRRDLYFRLDGITLVIPPLRERRGLISSMALRFLEEIRPSPPPRLSAEVLAALETYPWPGNVRELKAVIGRAALLAGGAEIGPRHLAFTQRNLDGVPPPVFARQAPAPAPAPAPAAALPLDFLDDDQRADRAHIVAVLETCGHNQSRTARELGIARTTLVNKLALYGIPRPRK